MPRITTPSSIEKMRLRMDLRKYEPVAKKILLAMLERKLVLEEQPLDDDGLHEVHEYFGELGDLEISSQRLKKHNGINPRFALKIVNNTTTVELSGTFAAKAYHMAAKAADTEENKADEGEVADLLAAIGD